MEKAVIQVVTLSPAVDVTYRVAKARIGSQHRVLETLRRAGGKGGNVARVASALGAHTTLVAPLAGEAGEWYRKEFEGREISCHFVDGDGATRQCITVTDESSATEFNEPAPALSDDTLGSLMQAIDHSPLTVISGSFPRGMSREKIMAVCERVRQLSDVVVFDTSGDAQAISLDYADFITPNRRELAELAATDGFDEAFTRLSPASPLVTVGEHGIVFDQQSPRVLVAPQQSGNTTGAGDAFVAGFAAAFSEGVERAVAYGAAVAAASVREPVAGDVNLSAVQELLSQVKEVSYAPHAY